MNLQDVRTGLAYNRWANQRLLKAAGELWAGDSSGIWAEASSRSAESFGISCGESGAGSSTGGRAHSGPSCSPSDFPDLPSIAQSWTSHDEEKAAFVGELTDEKLRAPCSVDENAYVLAKLIQNILTHSTHHRGQVVHMLRQLGRTPPETGFRHFLTENPERDRSVVTPALRPDSLLRLEARRKHGSKEVRENRPCKEEISRQSEGRAQEVRHRVPVAGVERGVAELDGE